MKEVTVRSFAVCECGMVVVVPVSSVCKCIKCGSIYVSGTNQCEEGVWYFTARMATGEGLLSDTGLLLISLVSDVIIDCINLLSDVPVKEAFEPLLRALLAVAADTDQSKTHKIRCNTYSNLLSHTLAYGGDWVGGKDDHSE